MNGNVASTLRLSTPGDGSLGTGGGSDDGDDDDDAFRNDEDDYYIILELFSG